MIEHYGEINKTPLNEEVVSKSHFITYREAGIDYNTSILSMLHLSFIHNEITEDEK